MPVDPEFPVDEHAFDLQLSADGSTVWVAAFDGSCIGRFSKRGGIDVHRSGQEMMAGKGECLYCTHSPAGPAEWNIFREQISKHYAIDIPADFIRW